MANASLPRDNASTPHSAENVYQALADLAYAHLFPGFPVEADELTIAHLRHADEVIPGALKNCLDAVVTS